MALPQTEPLSPDTCDALLLVDVRKDFLPGGRLAVPTGDGRRAVAQVTLQGADPLAP